MPKGKTEYQAKSDFFNSSMNSGKSHSQTKNDWKRSEEKAFYDKGEHLSGSNFDAKPDPNDPWSDYALASEDI